MNNQNPYQQMQSNISGTLNPNSPGWAPALNGNQPQMTDYRMKLAPQMQQAQVAQPAQVPYEQYLRDNQVQDSPILRLAWSKGLKPNQVSLLQGMRLQ